MNMTIDLTPIFQAVIALLAALVTYKLIPWIRSKTTKQQQDNLVAAAKIAVFAAEQIYGAAKGDEKLEYAMEALKKAGFTIDKTLAREAIEKAVHDMNEPRKVLDALADAMKDEEEPEEEEPAEDSPGDVKAPPDTAAENTDE